MPGAMKARYTNKIRQKEIDTLIALIGAALGGAGPFGKSNKAHIISSEDINWVAVLDLAKRSKTTGFLLSGASECAIALPKDIQSALEEFHKSCLTANFSNLAWSIKACCALEKAGIQVLIFKGVVRSQEVYGAWDKRRSADIDLLVRHEDYERAGYVLEQAGFKALVSPSNQWWHKHLGEAPFARFDGTGIVVDLHHQLQQPGGPFPRKLEGFFASSVEKECGKRMLHTLSRDHGFLVTVINFGKAKREGAPWLSYAHEMAQLLSQMDGDEFARIRVLAKQNGMVRLFDDAVLSAQTLFKLPPLLMSETTVKAEHSCALALSSIGQANKTLLERTRLLWTWCDNNNGRKVIIFSQQLIKVLKSEFARRREENLV